MEPLTVLPPHVIPSQDTARFDLLHPATSKQRSYSIQFTSSKYLILMVDISFEETNNC
jgi:hypothetical protein